MFIEKAVDWQLGPSLRWCRAPAVGLDLAGRFYVEAVRPIVERACPDWFIALPGPASGAAYSE